MAAASMCRVAAIPAAWPAAPPSPAAAARAARADASGAWARAARGAPPVADDRRMASAEARPRPGSRMRIARRGSPHRRSAAERKRRALLRSLVQPSAPIDASRVTTALGVFPCFIETRKDSRPFVLTRFQRRTGVHFGWKRSRPERCGASMLGDFAACFAVFPLLRAACYSVVRSNWIEQRSRFRSVQSALAAVSAPTGRAGGRYGFS